MEMERYGDCFVVFIVNLLFYLFNVVRSVRFKAILKVCIGIRNRIVFREVIKFKRQHDVGNHKTLISFRTFCIGKKL